MTQELYKRYRPKIFKRVVGQATAVKTLSNYVKHGSVPHTILFSGPSGCGKTTMARILKDKLQCSNQDFVERNAAEYRGIDSVRDIQKRIGLRPISGPCRIWLLDEVHQLSRDGQNALLKILEDTPTHVYFFLCTTDPQKLLKTIVTRSTEIRLGLCKEDDLRDLVAFVCKKEDRELDEDVVDKLVEVAEGSARKALVVLDAVLQHDDEAVQTRAILEADTQRQAVELGRALMNPKATWANVRSILTELDDEPESLRHMVLGYATSVLLKGGKQAARAYTLIDAFRDNFFDSKRAGLVAACYEVMTNR